MFGQVKWNAEVALPSLVLNGEGTDDDKQKLKSWLNANRPDAILTDIGELRRLLSEVGWEVPKCVGLAALSVLDGNADAGIDQNSHEIGRAAVQLLISLANHNERGIPKICREVLVEGFWVDGKTCLRRPLPSFEAAEPQTRNPVCKSP